MIGDKLGRLAYHPDPPATKERGTTGRSVKDEPGIVLRNMSRWESDWMVVREVCKPLDVKAALKKVSPNNCASLLKCSIRFTHSAPLCLFHIPAVSLSYRKRSKTDILGRRRSSPASSSYLEDLEGFCTWAIIESLRASVISVLVLHRSEIAARSQPRSISAISRRVQCEFPHCYSGRGWSSQVMRILLVDVAQPRQCLFDRKIYGL